MFLSIFKEDNISLSFLLSSQKKKKCLRDFFCQIIVTTGRQPMMHVLSASMLYLYPLSFKAAMQNPLVKRLIF